ncbi:MAG: hypothetical protein QOK37_1169 [Thermoanaerobaculia bacterium]|nr:hypothetical protein [Thermoanaerobaculia bacterium]
MKSIRLIAAVVFLLPSALFATVFQPATDRQLADRSDAVVVATVRDAAARVRADGAIVTDYRLAVEETLKGAASGTITVTETGGTVDGRFTYISDSAVYTPGERVMVFLKKRSDGTYFTTSMAMGKFSFTRAASGETVVTRDVSELRDDPARLADGFKNFVRDTARGQIRSEQYTTTLTPLANAFRPKALAFPPASAYSYGARWQGGESGAVVDFYVRGTLSSVPNAGSNIDSGLDAWTSDPSAFIVLRDAGAPPPGSSATPNTNDGLNIIYLGQSINDPECNGSQACALESGNFQHNYKGETFVTLNDADIIVTPSAGASQFEALITHELGHAIGFRHSNEPGSPQDCTGAIMSSSVNGALHSNLQQWDRDAVDTMYGNGPVCVPPKPVTIVGGGEVPAGQTRTLIASTVASCNSTLTYAWFEGIQPDASHPVGSNSSSFTTPPINDTKNYWVKVSNDCGNVTAATTVFPQQTTCTAPGIVTQPASATIASGATATLTVNTGGSPPFTYQWYQATTTADTTKPVGTNSPQFQTPALTQTTAYWVKVTNACGTAISSIATVSIAGSCTKPSFSIQPTGGAITPGAPTYLFAFATNAVSYQWYKGTAPDTSTPVTGSGPSNDRWINQIYIDLLGRTADAAAISSLGGALAGGATRPAVALTVLTSIEYRQRLLTGFYTTFLHRTPSAAELSFWMPAFAANLTDEQIESQFLASPEYFALASSSNASWIANVFSDVLGRTPSSAEVAAYSALLGSSSRATVGLSILTSNEAVTRRVQQYYNRYLHRVASTPEASAFVNAILGGTSDEQVIAQILGADEYFNYGTLLFTDPISATTSYWVRATNTCGTTDSATATLSNRQCTAPVITTQPKNVTADFGTQVSLSVLANDATTYQWYRAQSGDPSNPVSGGTGPLLTFVPQATGFTDYWVKVSNSCGSANSNTVTVIVNCAPRALTISTPPTAPSGTTYTVSWNADPQLDVRNDLQEATKSDFSDAVTFEVTGASSRTFTHTVTTDTRYYYRVANAPRCGGIGSYSRIGSTLVTAPQASTQTSFNLARMPCNGQNCTITQPLFIPGFTAAAKTALATGDTYSVTADEPFITITPASGALPSEGVTVNVVIDTTGLDIGSTQASVTVTRTRASGKTGAFGDPVSPTNVPVSISVVAPVTQTPKDPNASPFNALLIPAIAHADGIGTRFVSDVRLTNSANQSITYQLTFTPSSTDGTLTGKQATITVAAGETKALNDIVKDWYGSGAQGEAGLGSLEIRPTNYAGKDPVSISLATVAASRTYSVTPTGTFGQFIPALPLANFLARSDTSKISLQQVAQTSAAGGYRTNLGFVEGSGQPVDFVATLVDDAGNKLAERAYSLKPFESQQVKLDTFFNATGITLPNIADARVEFRVTSDTGRISAYASVLDNTTTDPLLVFPVDPSKIAATRFMLPGVAEFDSTLSNFHTDMRVFNGGASAANVTLTYFPQGSSTPSATTQVAIAAGEVKVLDNVLVNQFKLTSGNGSVLATTASDSSLVVTGRTFSRDKATGGTFGQFIPAVTVADSVGNGDRALQIVQLEESPAFRTNLGLMEVTGSDATVELLGYSPDSKVAARLVVPLAGGQYIQRGGILKSMGFSNVYNGRITAKVISGTGRIAAYGSVIDNRTTDPTYVPSQ